MGTRLGRYEVVKHLARGGMADLCVARATGIEGFERHVVIKHLRPEQSEDSAFVQMFVTEARLAAALHHHNIVQVHDIGQEAGRHFFAMEYVHGEDVRRLLSKLSERREFPPLEHVVTIATAVAAALHHAHEQKGSDRKALGIVHRDVTPANIIVGYDGNVKVVDFGIAKAAMRTSDTAVGMLKGKVPYMAPEQCTGKPIDRRSDVFALGIVLYELVTVRRLFKGGNEFFTMTAVVQGEIPKPTSQRRDLPAALEAIILKALSRKPSDRYQTADEMRIALDQFADKAGLRTSNTALADYMKKLFGQRPEPWMEDAPAIEQPVDFDKTETGLVAIPDEAIESTSIPKSVATTRGSLIEQARLNAISNKLEPTPKPMDRVTPAIIEKAAALTNGKPSGKPNGKAELKKPPPTPARGSSSVIGTPLFPPPPEPDEIRTEPANKKPTAEDQIKTAPGGMSRLSLATTPVAPATIKSRATSNEDTKPDEQKDPAVWMRVPRGGADEMSGLSGARPTARAITDIDEKTDVSTPPPPPERMSKVIVAVTSVGDRDNTEVVAPLPVEVIGENTDMTRQGVDRRWLLVGGIAVAALLVAIVIVVRGRGPDDAETENVATETKQPPPVEPKPEPKAEPAAEPTTGTTTTYRPLVNKPKTDEPKAEPAKTDEPKAAKADEPAKTDEPKPEPTTVDEPKTEPAKPPIKKPVTRPVTRPRTRPVTKPTSKDPKWDPDALFLKQKPK